MSSDDLCLAGADKDTGLGVCQQRTGGKNENENGKKRNELALTMGQEERNCPQRPVPTKQYIFCRTVDWTVQVSCTGREKRENFEKPIHIA